MLIGNYDIELFTPPCSPGSPKFAAIARFAADISEVLPYLNATLPGAVYSGAAPALTWKDGTRHTTFRPHEIAASDLEDRAQAAEVVDALVRRVNETWERRDAIEPDHTMRRRLTPLEVFKLLPRTDCRECGQASCYQFAVRMAAGQALPDGCPPLRKPEYAAQGTQLEALFARAS
jgi:ArsR family metal-binding transcriptional regulator